VIIAMVHVMNKRKFVRQSRHLTGGTTDPNVDLIFIPYGVFVL
jgi:hypothetical protein